MTAVVVAAYLATLWAALDAWAHGRDRWCVVFVAGLLILSLLYAQLVRLRNIVR